jgi:CRP-like cAMP-binding protein
MAVGALLAPALVDRIGLRGAMAVVGTLPLLAGLASLPRMRALDHRLKAPAELAVLRGVPAFADLPAPALERLAHTAERVQVPATSIVVAEGGTSDRFYVIISGEVQVSRAGRVLRVEGPGDFFGEIGLLRNVLRTATVTATLDSELLVLDQADFLAVVSHRGESVSAFDDVITRRLYA